MSLPDESDVQAQVREEAVAWLARTSGKSTEEIMNTELFEKSLAAFCLRAGANSLANGAIDRVDKSARWQAAHAKILPGFIIVEYNMLSDEQCAQMALVLNTLIGSVACLSDGNMIFIKIAELTKINLFEK